MSDVPDAKRQFTHEPLKALLRDWKDRADEQGITGKRRDEGCLDFFTGAAALGHDILGPTHPLTVRLLKICIYVISLRGEKGLVDHIVGLERKTVPAVTFRWGPIEGRSPQLGEQADMPEGRLVVQRAREGSHSFLAHWNGRQIAGQTLPQKREAAKALAQKAYVDGKLPK